MTWLVAGEIVKIHAYLLKAPRLRYLVGASLLLETFARQVAPALASQFHGSTPLATAGRFLAEFYDETNAMLFLSAMRAAGLALFGPEHLLLSGPWEKNGNILKIITGDLERQKVQATAKAVNTLVGLQYLERCGACQSWGVLPEPPRDGDRLCQVCKYKFLARQRRSLTIPNLNSIPYADNPYLPVPREGQPFPDFHDIAGETGDLGIFYADGNAMGKIFAGLVEAGDIQRYIETSQEINKWNKCALEKAAKSISHNNKKFSGVVLICGGDDLLVALPAREAVQFAQIYLCEISNSGTPFTNGVSGGLVISKPNLPFRLVLARAEELVQNAKKQVRLLGKGKDNCQPQDLTALDFMVITSSLIEPLASRADRLAYPYTDYSNFVLFTARPYLIEEFNQLVGTIKNFKKAWAAPSKFYLEFLDIFRPGDLPRSGRLNDRGEFKKFLQLCHRYATLYPEKRKIIENFQKGTFLTHGKWSEILNLVGYPKEAVRLWHADVPDLVDYVEEV